MVYRKHLIIHSHPDFRICKLISSKKPANADKIFDFLHKYFFIIVILLLSLCLFSDMYVHSRIKSKLHSILVIVLFTLSGLLKSQDGAGIADKVYGLDPTLYNGKKYTYFLPASTGSHQYLFSPDYVSGSVTINGKTYEGILLNYDIYNQQLLLKFADETGAMNILEVSGAWLESFLIGTTGFEYLDIGKGPRIYQVLGSGPVRANN